MRRMHKNHLFHVAVSRHSDFPRTQPASCQDAQPSIATPAAYLWRSFAACHGLTPPPPAAALPPFAPPLPPRHAPAAADYSQSQRRRVPCRAGAGEHLQPAGGAPHGRVRTTAGVAAVRRAGARPVVPAVEERHGHGRPRRQAVHRRPVPRRLRPRRPRLPQRAGRGDPRHWLRLHRRLPRRHPSQQVSSKLCPATAVDLLRRPPSLQS